MRWLGVVGLGPAGCLFLACLPPERLANVVVFEDGCVGGDLFRLWGSVRANLTRTELIRALRSVPRWSVSEFEILDGVCGEEECPMLQDLCRQLRVLMEPILAEVVVHSARVVSVHQVPSGWTVRTSAGTDYSVARLILCTGATPKQMDLPKPVIPLEIALSRRALGEYLGLGLGFEKKVVVFGTSHSGTLVLSNLREAGCTTTGIYRGVCPFRWARYHDPEGLKQESAVIADEIVAGSWGSLTPTLVPTTDIAGVIRAVHEADYVVYAVGFESRRPMVYGLSGGLLQVALNPDTAELAPGLWGFGIGFPSLYDLPKGGKAPDIGFGGFVAHIRKCMGRVLL